MVISQNAASRPERYQDARLEVDFTSVSASLDSRGIVLTQKEYELLAFLVQHAGETVPRDILLERVWGNSAKHRGRTLDVHIRHLRKKFGADNGGHVLDRALSPDAALTARFDRNLLGGVTVISGGGLTAVPYYAWNNRGRGEMTVWIDASR